MRYKRILLLLCLIGVNLIGSKVYAYDKDTVAAGKGDSKNVYHWHQSRTTSGIPSVPEDAWNFEIANGSTLGGMGCGYFAVSYMLVKMGEESPSKGFTPITFAKAVKDKKLYRESEYVDFPKVNTLYPNVTCEENRVGISNKTKEEQIAYVKGKYEDGYYVIICLVSNDTSGHYVFVDGFDESGNMIIGDSGFPGNKWSDSHEGANAYIDNVTVFSHKSKKANEQPSIYDGVNLATDSTMTDSEEVLYKGLVSEFELEGLPEYPSYVVEQIHLDFEDDSNLSVSELSNIRGIKNDMEVSSRSVLDVVDTFISFLGLCLIVYSVLLAVAVIFDEANNFLDLSLVSILTIGNCKLVQAEKAEEKYLEKGELTRRMCIIRAVIVLVVGLVLVSGIHSYLINYFCCKMSWG